MSWKYSAEILIVIIREKKIIIKKLENDKKYINDKLAITSVTRYN